MILTIVESPFQSADDSFNRSYLDLCLLDCLTRGESPYASHKMLTDCLDDRIPEQRALGIAAGLAWRRLAHKRVFYVDLGWSTGMNDARALYEKEHLVYVWRNLPPILLARLDQVVP